MVYFIFYITSCVVLCKKAERFEPVYEVLPEDGVQHTETCTTHLLKMCVEIYKVHLIEVWKKWLI